MKHNITFWNPRNIKGAEREKEEDLKILISITQMLFFGAKLESRYFLMRARSQLEGKS